MEIRPEQKQRRDGPSYPGVSGVPPSQDEQQQGQARQRNELRPCSEIGQRNPERENAGEPSNNGPAERQPARQQPGAQGNRPEQEDDSQPAGDGIDPTDQHIGQPGMFDPGPVRHGVGVWIQGGKRPPLIEKIQSGSKVPAEIRFSQRLERKVQDDKQEERVERCKSGMPSVQ